MTQEINPWTQMNAMIIKEFRANKGKVGGPLEGVSILILHTIGAKSGNESITPLTYLADGNRWLVFASDAGAPTNPGWYYNLLAHPNATVEIGTQTVDVQATILHGKERDEFFAKQVAILPLFAEHQAKTTRIIPVIALSTIR